MIRQKPTIDKTDVPVRVPARPGSQVQDRAGHLLLDPHPLSRDQRPRHHAARVLPRFGDGRRHVGGEPWVEEDGQRCVFLSLCQSLSHR